MVKYTQMNKHHNSIAFSLTLIITDILAIIGAYSLAYILRVKLSDAPVVEYVAAWPYFLSLLSLIPFILILLVLLGTYSQNKNQGRFGQLTRIILGAIGAMLFLITIDYFSLDTIFPAKLIPVYALGFSILLLATSRSILYSLRWWWLRQENNLKQVIIVGDNSIARDIASGVDRKNSGYRVMAVIGDKRFKFTTHRQFNEAVKDKAPDVVIQVASSRTPTIDPDLLQYSLENYAEFKFIPSDVSDLPNKIDFEIFMNDILVMNIQQTPLAGWGRIAKRLLDILASGLALLLLSPILLFIAVANKLILGKVIFHHTRLTRGNREFQIYKFQTVRNDLNGLTPEEAFRKLGKPELIKQYRANGDALDDDPRYGRWSQFLRKTSLDELPQFWNVLIGDISLVGPRALIPQELNQYNQKHLILNVKSGITGLAQISGRRDLPWEERRKLDVYYVQNWSFALDIQILLNTAWQVIVGRGAQ